jgi:SOS-response transcriptional repressor LexA
MTNFDINKIKSENLRRIMDVKGLTPTRLAELIGVQQPHISACLNGARNIGQITINKICTALKIDKSEFFNIAVIAIESPIRLNKPIPVISWVSAGHFTECTDHWPTGISGEGDPVYSIKKVSSNSFGLRIVGDSMAPRYMAGDVIIVDPDIQCDNNCPCVIKLNGEVTFKMFHENDTEIKLSSLNEKYPDIIIRKDSKVDFKVIGKVVDMIPKL